MARFLASIRILIGALAVVGLLGLAAPAGAQQPTSVNPTASAVKEEQLLRELNRISGRCTLPDQKACMLEQPAGRDWRLFHEQTLRWIGGIAIVGMLLAIAVFYARRGMIRLESGRTGRTIVRFNAFERFVHWMTASCFVLQALTGLNITFGKQLLLPVMGPDAFATWSQLGKYVHNYLSIPFTLGVLVIFFMWIGGNIPNKVDVEWVKRGGGLVGHDHPPAQKFNAGQKGIYWVQMFAGVAIAITGYVLIFPFYGTDIGTMQTAQVIHGVVAMLYIALIIAHIYIGTIGMEGAFEGMGSGTVDVNWAKEHHSLWYEEAMSRAGAGDMPRRSAAVPAE